MIENPDFYAELNLTRDATPEDIRRAYHKAARQMHPDVSVEIGATENFLKVQMAYDVLSDPVRRKEYDLSLPPVSDPPAIVCATSYSRASLIKLDEPQLLYVLLEVTAPAQNKTSPSPPLNVCLVLDRSTSMQGERMDIVKSTAIEIIRQLKPQDIFSIVAFSDRAEVLVSSGQRQDLATIESRIQKILTGGGTEIFRGLEAGFFEVRNKFSTNFTNHIVLLTDGRTYGDEAACQRVADQAAAYGIGISGLGIGDEWNDVFLDSLATRTGGSSLYISKNSDIKEILKKKFIGLGQVYAERVIFELHPKPNVELQYAFRISPDANPLPSTTPLRLGVLPKGPGLSFLLEFKIGPINEITPVFAIAEGKLLFDVPGQRQIRASVELLFTRSVSDTPKVQAPPTKLLQAISRLTLYRMQESANQYLADGETENASQYLQNLATHLFTQGEHDLARVAMQEAENIARNIGLSESGKKQIKYGTRALLLPEGSAVAQNMGRQA